MKNYLKIFLVVGLLFIASGCGKTVSNNSSVEDLLDVYMEGFKNADVDKMLSVYPDFAKDYYGKYVTEENVRNALDNYGDNIKLSYDITGKEKLSSEELNQLNEEIKQTFTNYVLPSDCYKISGTTEAKGSKNKNMGTIKNMWYCNFNDTWRLFGE